MSSLPMGFGISPRLQEHMCRLGSKLAFAEGSEEFRQFLDIDISDKQIERVSHCYGERLEELDWEIAYCDLVQMKINYKEEEPVYAMVDGRLRYSSGQKERLNLAIAKGVLGSDHGWEILRDAVMVYRHWDKGWNFTGLGQFGLSMSFPDSVIIAVWAGKYWKNMPTTFTDTISGMPQVSWI